MKEADLLIKGDCPYRYDCKHPDCMECMKIHNGEKEE